ncbi:hypothetical protein LMG26685_01824 [Achromobacter mucicolens]|nr:hypothetical protein LMG26685_01824 [Achromobacter mucicolens]
MNGIDFILRDRTGWTPPVPLPRRRLRWADPKQEAMRPEELAFIKDAKGRLPSVISWAQPWARSKRRTPPPVVSRI